MEERGREEGKEGTEEGREGGEGKEEERREGGKKGRRERGREGGRAPQVLDSEPSRGTKETFLSLSENHSEP